ncbi:hypothetical protein AB0D86_42185 [Streptomyces sp. NPDC048324]|uniref:hypothetical protein n=1 Tax=Streptomyces sp. NPDC048324 TaxID=3157205 RepID=UPI0034145C4E
MSTYISMPAVRRPFAAAAELYPQANRSRLAGMTRTSLSRILPGRGDLALLFARVSSAEPAAASWPAALPRLQLVEVGR